MKPYYQDEWVTLYHADAFDVMKMLSDGSVDFVFTDPPYGHNNNNGDLISRREVALGESKIAKEPRPILNDGPEANELVQRSFKEFRRLLKPGCVCCCCGGGGGPDPQFARWSLWLDQHLEFKQMVVWDKGPMGLGWHYRRSYEVVLVGAKDGAACRWNGAGNVENIIRPGDYGIKKIIPEAQEHPTPKPWQLAAHFIKLHSSRGDLVLDPFNGGGSTAYACKQLQRRYIGCDLDKRWLDLTIEKLRQEVLFSIG